MPPDVIDIGPPAHEDEKAALRFLAQGLPDHATVFTNPWLAEPSGAVYELDAVVVMPHAIYVVEIKGWRGHLRGETRDWYLPETRRSPLQLARKTAQILHTLLRRVSHEAGRVWVQELIFLPAAASFTSHTDAVRKRVALRSEIHAVLQDTHRIQQLANRRIGTNDAGSHEVLNTLMTLLKAKPRQRPPTHVAGYTIIDRFDTNDRFQEVLGEDISQIRRLLRIYRVPWDASDADRAQIVKRATWEASVLRSFSRAPEDIGLLQVDKAEETDEGIVVPMEYFDGETLPAWLETRGGDMDLRTRVALWVRIARTLAWTHQGGVIHRQLRPDLILVKGDLDPRDPKTPAFRVTGFEMAKRQGHQTTIAWSDAALNRLEGAAPEVLQMVSDAIPASDQFSLGLVLALLVLRKPLLDSTLPLVERRHRIPHLRDYDPDIPQRLDDAVARMLERKPADRFRSVDEAIAHVLDAVQAEPGSPREGLTPGARVGTDYLVEGRLGEGGLSDVYKVKHQLLGERFALKVARPTEVAELAIRCEYYALKSLSHPSVVRVHDLSRMVEDRITLRLDLVPGTTLTKTVLDASLPAHDLLARRRLGEDLLAALDEFERVGLSHNDLKPDNLMVTPTGRLVIIDFSLARSPQVEEKTGKPSPIGGTLDWRDPSDQPTGHATDRYAAAMCLFWLHAGRHPFDGRVPEPDEAPDFDAAEFEPEALDAFFRAALHPVPAERFPSARAMRDGYLAAMGAPATSSEDPQAPLTPETALAEAGLPPRAVRALHAAQVTCVAELLRLDDDALTRIPGLGARLASKVRDLMTRARAQGITPRTRGEPDAPPFFRHLAFEPAPVADLAVDTSVIDALRQAGLRTIGDVAGRSRQELERLPRIGRGTLQRLAEALVQWQDRTRAEPSVETLDGVWERATRALDETSRRVMELSFGIQGGPLIQAEIGQQLGLEQSGVSQRKTAALARLDRDVLADVKGAVDSFLDVERGVLPLAVAADRLAREFPTAAVEPDGIIRLLASLDTRTFHLIEGLPDEQVVLLARPWFTRDLMITVAQTAASLVNRWPPEPPEVTRKTLRMMLPEFEGDPLLLARRLLPDVLLTAGGALFQPPVGVVDALTYALQGAREGLSYAQAVAEVERLLQGKGPIIPPIHELNRLLDGTPWHVQGTHLVRRESAGAPPDRPEGDNPRELLSLDATVDPLDRIREMLREAASRGHGFRLVVAPPERHLEVARSLVDPLEAVAVDLTDAWFRRYEGTLNTDARAARFPALRVAASKRLDALITDLVAEHGAPNRTVVLYHTGLLEALGGLEQVRLLYDRVRGQSVGFWILVIPGLVMERQPLFNDRTPVWHMPGLVLPLAEPLRP